MKFTDLLKENMININFIVGIKNYYPESSEFKVDIGAS